MSYEGQDFDLGAFSSGSTVISYLHALYVSMLEIVPFPVDGILDLFRFSQDVRHTWRLLQDVYGLVNGMHFALIFKAALWNPF